MLVWLFSLRSHVMYVYYNMHVRRQKKEHVLMVALRGLLTLYHASKIPDEGITGGFTTLITVQHAHKHMDISMYHMWS